MIRLFATWALAGMLWGLTSLQPLAAQPANQLTTSESLSGWKLLFDGESTAGWRNYGKQELSSGWKVVDGALVRAENGAGDIVTTGKYKAFELSLEYNISKGGNSGVMFHVTENRNPPWHSGPEIQVQDNRDGRDPQKAGWLYQLYKPGRDNSTGEPIDATRPAGEWNQLYIRIAPNQCEVSLNGVMYYRFKLGDQQWERAGCQEQVRQHRRLWRRGRRAHLPARSRRSGLLSQYQDPRTQGRPDRPSADSRCP
jgi:hypothetical protein